MDGDVKMVLTGRRELISTGWTIATIVLAILLAVALGVIGVLLVRLARRKQWTLFSRSSDRDDEDDLEGQFPVLRKKKSAKLSPDPTMGNHSNRGSSVFGDTLGKAWDVTPEEERAIFGIDMQKLKFGSIIGQGAKGMVYRASYLGAEVAVKEIKQVDQSDKLQEDFLTELAALRRLRHPHVVELYGAAIFQSSDDPNICRYLLVTELAPCSLRDLLDSEEVVSFKQALRLVTEVGKGLAFIHAQKIVHFDIKPANLLLSDSGRVKICDLGIAKLGSGADEVQGSVTGTAVHGTPSYIAPEILKGDYFTFSYEVDVYSWSIVFWELLHRENPHPEHWTLAMLFNKVLDGYRPKIGPLTPARIRRLIVKCWSGNSSLRPNFESILVELSWIEQELRCPEKAFLTTHQVQVWKEDQFVPARITRNMGDGNYEVVLATKIGSSPLLFHANDILLIDGGGGVGPDEGLDLLAGGNGDVKKKKKSMNTAATNGDAAAKPFSFRIINDEEDEEKKMKPRVETPPGFSSVSEGSDTDQYLDKGDESKKDQSFVDIDGIRINENGIIGAPGTANSVLSWRSSLVMLNELGRGASGIVVRALELGSFGLVAVKSIRIHDIGQRKQIAKEIRSLDQTVKGIQNDESLLKMYGAFYDPDDLTVKIVTEYMDGGSCDDLLINWRRPSEELLVAIAMGTLRSLTSLHKQRRLHRDIKPANILIDRRAGAKLSDLGLAKDLMVSNANADALQNDAMAETFVGTVSYMSLERLEGKAYSFPCDIWSFGVTMTCIALGDNPVRHKSFFQLLEFLKNNRFPEVDNSYSELFRDFLSKSLHPDPEKRATANELLEHEWVVQYSRPDMPYPQAIMRAHIERAAEGQRYKRDELNMIAARTYEHLGFYHKSKDPTSQVIIPLSKVRNLGEQIGVPSRHVVKAFKRQQFGYY